MLENDGGTLKVSIGSLIESQGSLYVVDTAAETPSGSAVINAYLFFDDSGGGSFAWSVTAGTFDPTRGGIYDVSDRRQCRFKLSSMTTWNQLVVPEADDALIDGNQKVDGALSVVAGISGGAGMSISDFITAGGDLTVNGRYRAVNVLHGAATTEETIFEALKAFIPNNGDKMLIWGAGEQSTLPFTISYAERISSTIIRFFGLRDNAGVVDAVTYDVDDGAVNTIDISIAW